MEEVTINIDNEQVDIVDQTFYFEHAWSLCDTFWVTCIFLFQLLYFHCIFMLLNDYTIGLNL